MASNSSTEPTVSRVEREEDDDSKPAADDEDTGAQVAPIVQLQEVAVSTGEEDEDVLLELWVFFSGTFSWLKREWFCA